MTSPPNQLVCLAVHGRTLLEVAEANDVKIPSGCRMAMCGSDPVYIVEGSENLSPVSHDEQDTLTRVGLPLGWRMACSAKVQGPVVASQTSLEEASTAEPLGPPAFQVDKGVQDVVIVGNGVAGATAADYIRRYHPDCNVTIVARESYHFYNRMAVSKLIHGGTDLDQITLMPQTWYQERRIECLLGSEVVRIDRARSMVVTDRRRMLHYDRLLLAMGSGSFIPPIPGWGISGTFALRNIDDALGLRDYALFQSCQEAVVLGGGLLGLEAGHALTSLGLHVTMLVRDSSVLQRQLDPECAALLLQILRDLRIEVLLNTELTGILGEDKVEAVDLGGGRVLKCDLILATVGVRPVVDIAIDAALDVNLGVVVDDELRTSDSAIYAVGDLAEHRETLYGIWPASVEQAKIAAANLLGDHQSYQGTTPVTQLKLQGVELVSLGEFNATEEDQVIQLIEPEERRYRLLVLHQGRIKGAILLGYPQEATAVVRAAKDGLDMSSYVEDLKAGRWDVISG